MKTSNRKSLLLVCFLSLAAAGLQAVAAGKNILSPKFDDRPLEEPVQHPAWFKLSFLDIYDDVKEAIDANKKGLIIYFGMSKCPYCKALLEVNFGKQDIETYTRKNFDVVAIDVRGSRTVTDIKGKVMSEKQYAIAKNANFTPTLIFFNDDYREVFRLVGYYPPYKFRAALEYVADGHYKKEKFNEYLARGEMPPREDARALNKRDFFLPPPHMLDRSRVKAQKPLIVIFEQKECHACDVLHTGPLANKETLKKLDGFNVVQLDIWKETPLITPAGKRTTARKWAKELGIFYTPTLIMYDEAGKERLRLASVVHFYRLSSALAYMQQKAYKKYKNYRAWRESHK
jgi:thioredoxin-related protein